MDGTCALADDALGECGDPATLIHDVQGAGMSSPLAGPKPNHPSLYPLRSAVHGPAATRASGSTPPPTPPWPS